MSPSEIRVSRDRTRLDIAWPDGSWSHLDAGYLRARCRSADALRSALDEAASAAPEGVRIVGLDLVGRYAINVTFSDGRERGIYPWSYLRELGDAVAITRPAEGPGEIAPGFARRPR